MPRRGGPRSTSPPTPPFSVSSASPTRMSTRSARPAAARFSARRGRLRRFQLGPDQLAAAAVAERAREVDGRDAEATSELDDPLGGAGAGAHVEERPELGRDAQVVARVAPVHRLVVFCLLIEDLAGVVRRRCPRLRW